MVELVLYRDNPVDVSGTTPRSSSVGLPWQLHFRLTRRRSKSRFDSRYSGLAIVVLVLAIARIVLVAAISALPIANFVSASANLALAPAKITMAGANFVF